MLLTIYIILRVLGPLVYWAEDKRFNKLQSAEMKIPDLHF